jgi:hypothetical protein
VLPGSGCAATLREVLHGGVVAGVLVTVAGGGDGDRSGGRGRAGGGAVLPRPRSAPGRPAEAPALPGLVGSSPAWQAVLRRAAEVADAPVVVVTGECGSGRAAVARALAGRRADLTVVDGADVLADPGGPWTTALAAAVERRADLLVRGADALPDRLAALLQAQLRRRSGGRLLLTGGPADARDAWPRRLLPDAAPAVLEVPALRDRAADVPALVRALSGGPRSEPLRLTLEAETALRRWSWPGNVEELRALVTRLATAVADRPVALADLPAELSRTPRAFTGLEQAERAAITAALRASGGNRSHAAEALGIGRATLYRKLRHYGLAD